MPQPLRSVSGTWAGPPVLVQGSACTGSWGGEFTRSWSQARMVNFEVGCDRSRCVCTWRSSGSFKARAERRACLPASVGTPKSKGQAPMASRESPHAKNPAHTQVIKTPPCLLVSVGRRLLQNGAGGPEECEGSGAAPSDASKGQCSSEPRGGRSSPRGQQARADTRSEARGPRGPTPWRWQRASPPRSCRSQR